MDISVDCTVVYTVRVDTETGEVKWVLVNLDSPQIDQVFNGDVNDNDLPEYLPLDHPISLKAIEIFERVQVTGLQEIHGDGSELALRYRVEG